YFLSSIPIVVFAALPIAGAGWLIARLILAKAREGMADWVSNPSRLAITGIAISVLVIQLVMRQCFEFSNLLLADAQSAGWLWRVMLSRDESVRTLFFSSLVAGAIVTGWLLWAARKGAEQTSRPRFLTGLLALLVAIQFLLLPVNYGVMIID